MSTPPPSRLARRPPRSIGAGFAGLCAAIKLQEAGETDFVVIEKGADVGGTWRDNTYPGAACDVPSQLYSYSFAPNPDWSTSFSPQPEIQAYIKRVAERVRHAGPVRLRHRRRGRPLGRRRASAGSSRPPGGTVRRPHPDQRRRRPLRAEAARHRGHRDLPGRALPLRPLGPRRRPRPASGSRSSAPAPPRSRSSRRSSSRSATSTSTSAPRRTSCRATTALHARSRRPRFKRVPGLQTALPHRDLLGPRDATCPASRSSPSSPAPAKKLALQQHRARASTTPSCARRSPRPSRSAASGS